MNVVLRGVEPAEEEVPTVLFPAKETETSSGRGRCRTSSGTTYR
jgi:hypothetical protein